MIDYYTVDLNNYGRLRGSPIINPFMFGYSALNGLSYRQTLRYNQLFSGDRRLQISREQVITLSRKNFTGR